MVNELIEENERLKSKIELLELELTPYRITKEKIESRNRRRLRLGAVMLLILSYDELSRATLNHTLFLIDADYLIKYGKLLTEQNYKKAHHGLEPEDAEIVLAFLENQIVSVSKIENNSYIRKLFYATKSDRQKVGYNNILSYLTEQEREFVFEFVRKLTRIGEQGYASLIHSTKTWSTANFFSEVNVIDSIPKDEILMNFLKYDNI